MSAFPEAFSDLENLSGWALSTERERNSKRNAASSDELRNVYAQMKPRIRPAIDYLEKFSLAELEGPEQRLMWFCFAMAEVAFAVEKYDAAGRVPFAIDPARMVPLHDR